MQICEMDGPIQHLTACMRAIESDGSVRSKPVSPAHKSCIIPFAKGFINSEQAHRRAPLVFDDSSQNLRRIRKTRGFEKTDSRTPNFALVGIYGL